MKTTSRFVLFVISCALIIFGTPSSFSLDSYLANNHFKASFK